MRDEIEKKAPSRLKRLPFIVQCAMLYAFMSCPLFITSQLPKLSKGSFIHYAINIIMGCATAGLLMQVIGDTQKSLAKAKGEGLVTTGLYSIFRHPNYTGEG